MRGLLFLKHPVGLEPTIYCFEDNCFTIKLKMLNKFIYKI